MFLTATESAWRNAFSSDFDEGGIVVGIGYPIPGKLFDMDRRAVDLTPPTEPPMKEFGGADIFLDFIERIVRPAVKSRLSKTLGISVFREALFGHSFGGIFALHALFTRPQSFDCFMASSPSLWWNEMSMMNEAKSFSQSLERLEKSPSLMVFWGSLEQNPVRFNYESTEEYEERKKSAGITRMADNALDLYSMLSKSGRLQALIKHEYEGEDHTSVMASSVSRCLAMFFEDWPVRRALSEVTDTAPPRT